MSWRTSFSRAAVAFSFSVTVLPAAAHRHHAAVAPVMAQMGPLPSDAIDPRSPVEVACQQCPADEVVDLLYRDVLDWPFVASQAVEADRRMVSVDIKGPLYAVRLEAESYLAGLGFTDDDQGGVHQVGLPKPPAPAPPKPPVKPRLVSYAYSPSWRDPSDLAAELQPLFPDSRFSGGAGPSSSESLASSPGFSGAQGSPYGGAGGAPGPSAPAIPSAPRSSAASDTLLFLGPEPDRSRLVAMLPDVDTPEAQVMIKASVFEVDLGSDDGSSFNLAAAVLRSKLQVAVNATPTASASPVGLATSGPASFSGNVISFGTSNLDAVIAALSSDSRFHLVTAPSALAKSGGDTSLSVGEDVPVLASVAYAGVAATAVQSVSYQDAGVILSVRPVVHRSVIDLDLHQEISSFVATTTGVNSTPTKQDRELDTSVAVGDGQVIAMAGLTQTSRGRTSSGLPWPFRFIGSDDVSSSRTDVLMVLQVVQVAGPEGVDELRTQAADRALPRPLGPPVEAAQ